jgi:hypothetical protein
MQRAVNPKTGEVLFLVNNQWTAPLQTARNPQSGQMAYLVNNEWQVLDPFKQEEKGFFDRLSESAQSQQLDTEAKTRNPLMGALARVSGLAGAALEVPDTVAQLMSNLTGLPKDQVFELPIDTVGKKLADKALNYEKDIGYAPTTLLKDISDNPLNVIPFVAERIVTSAPDMAAAYAAAPAYFLARTNEILKQRVENDEKTLAEATVGDVSAAAGAAAFETTFEKFATGRLLPGAGAVGKTAPGRIAKEAGVQSATEFAEEFATYAGETAGTKKGFDPAEATLAGIEGAIVGGGMGTAVQGAKEIIQPGAGQAPTQPSAAPAPPPTSPTAPPTAPTPTTLGAPPTEVSPVVPIPPGPDLLGGYVDAGNNTEVRITPTPDGRFQVIYVDGNSGQSADAGIFDDFDGANSTAAMLVGVNPSTFAPPAAPEPAPEVVTPEVAAPEAIAPEAPVEAAPVEAPVVTPPAAAAEPQRPAKDIQIDINKARQDLRKAETAFKKNQVGQEAVDFAAARLSTLEAEKTAIKAPEVPAEVMAPEVEAVPELPAKRQPKTVFEEKMFGKEPILSEEELAARKDISEKQRALNTQYNRIKGTKGFGNLADFLSGRAAQPAKVEGADRPLPDGMLVLDEDLKRIDFGLGKGATLKRNNLVSKTGRGRPLQQLIEDEQLNEFLPDDLKIFVRAEDVYDPNEFAKVRNAVDHIIERIENNDFLTEDDKMALRVIDEDIQKLSQEMTLEQVNARLAEIAAEERAGEAEAIAPPVAEEDIRGAAPTTVREPSPEERRQADLERDLFQLSPPAVPERTTPIGAQRDLFGAAGYTPENVTKRKKENAQQLSLFDQSPLPQNEDNKAGADARREAVSTVDALQSTDTPLALALSTDYARRQRVSLVGQTLTGYDDLAVLSQVYRHPRFETFRMFFVNDKGEVVSQLGVSSRLPASAVAIVGDDSVEYMKKVQDAAVKGGATGVWMLHNHPSGNVEVSQADKNLTKTFTKNFDKLAYKGHIVIDTNKYSVITPEGDVKTLSKDMGQKDLVKVAPFTVSEIFNPIEMAQRVDQNPSSMVVVAINNSAKVTGITTISNDFFEGKTRDQARRALYKLSIANIGGRLAVASRDAKALDKVAPMVEDGILIQPDGSYKRFSSMYTFRTKFLFPDERPGVVTPDTSKLFDFLRVPKVPRIEGPGFYRWSDARRLMEQQVTIKVQEPQEDLFGEDAKTLNQINEELPKAKKKLPPGRSPELAAMAEQLQAGQLTKEEYDAAVNKYRPIPVYTEPLVPATDEQVIDALSSDKKPKANVSIPNGTKVGLRLDIPAWNNHKTFVVSIHEGRPKPTSAKPGLAIGYRSVAMAKNVTFALSNQAKALEIAAGQAKDALQTMEGEYVNVSPAEAYQMAQQAIKDPRYVQLGFDPTRHAYFFDRATTLPVVKADAVLQIGNMILARGVEYGSKQNFLYNIDATAPVTEVEVDAGRIASRDEQIAEYTRLRAKRSQLIKEYVAQGPSIELQRNIALTDELAKQLKEDIDASAEPSLSPENFLRRALDAYEKGDLSPEVLATIRDAYVKTPWVLNGLRLSVRKPKQDRASGNFQPFTRVVTLWNGTSGIEDPSTVRHEIMHSLEQMMTVPQKKIILDAWKSDFDAAVKKNKDAQSQLFFKNALEFLDTPSEASFAAAVQSMPSYDFYQYLNPSEYWAINAEKLFAAKLGTQWDRFKSAVRKLIESMKKVFGFDNRLGVHKVFDRLMKDQPQRMSYPMLTDFVTGTGARAMVPQNVSKNIFGQPMPKATWGSPDESKIDDILYVLQDKNIDTKRVVQKITAQRKNLIDSWNPYLQEELYHGRTAKQTEDFLKDELEPLMKALRDRNLTMDQVEEYLQNRHAEERNIQNAKRDPTMPDGGSGILTADAQTYLAALTPKQKKDFDDIAKMVDDIVKGTQDLIVSSGQEKQEVIDNWNKAYKHYVPLNREEADYDVKNVGVGVGSGFAIKGPFSRASVGSGRKVVDILANVAMQRERAIIRAEKLRVAKAVYALAVTNPNPGFWLPYDPYVKKDPQQLVNDLISMGINPSDAQNIADTPTRRDVDPATNTVKEIPNERLITSALSLPVRINGEEKFIIFNSKDPRAVRMVEALKNLDVDQLSKALSVTQMFTQYFAKINTQYNPVFGVINFTRDVQGAMLQLSTTPIAGKQKQVLAGVMPAIRGIYGEERSKRKGQPPTNRPWAKLWEEFQQEGGQTGFRDMFSRSQERTEALQRILDPSSWTKSPLGKVFTAGGTLKVPAEMARKAATPLFDWLSDYNQTMENAVRLSAYKVALDQGMTKQQAASVAKNLTVNFNRKGQIGRQMGALYAFFNASVQGTTRMYETLKGPAGIKIIGGGVLLGIIQAMWLAAAGFDEDEPPEFVKERNIVLPTGGSKYVTIPMPLGYNVIPNTSRILAEWTLSGFKDTPKRISSIFSATLDMFNPLGNAGWSAQTITPTVLDPVIALKENKDWTGKPIAKEDISGLDPTPGYTRARETASIVGKGLSEFLNYASGGTKYTPGELSPTPDQIDYLIGQFTGGVGREAMKVEQTLRSQVTGEDLPIYKVPLVGRFVGDSQGLAAERNRFYNNIIQLNKHEREIKGRRENRENVQEYLMDNPDARLFSYANQVERNIQTLRKRRDLLLEKGAPKEQVKAVENQIAVQMKRFNDRVAAAQR